MKIQNALIILCLLTTACTVIRKKPDVADPVVNHVDLRGTSWTKTCFFADENNYFSQSERFVEKEGGLFYQASVGWYGDSSCKTPVRRDEVVRRVTALRREAGRSRMDSALVSNTWTVLDPNLIEYYNLKKYCEIDGWKPGVETQVPAPCGPPPNISQIVDVTFEPLAWTEMRDGNLKTSYLQADLKREPAAERSAEEVICDREMRKQMERVINEPPLPEVKVISGFLNVNSGILELSRRLRKSQSNKKKATANLLEHREAFCYGKR